MDKSDVVRGGIEPLACRVEGRPELGAETVPGHFALEAIACPSA